MICTQPVKNSGHLNKRVKPVKYFFRFDSRANFSWQSLYIHNNLFIVSLFHYCTVINEKLKNTVQALVVCVCDILNVEGNK